MLPGPAAECEEALGGGHETLRQVTTLQAKLGSIRSNAFSPMSGCVEPPRKAVPAAGPRLRALC